MTDPANINDMIKMKHDFENLRMLEVLAASNDSSLPFGRLTNFLDALDSKQK